jgi:hypothetical protein
MVGQLLSSWERSAILRGAMRLKLVVVLVAGFVVIAGGCGGGSKKSASPTTTSTAVTSTAAAATTASTTTTPSTKTSAPSFASVHNCVQLAALGAQVAKSLQPTAGNLQATLANETRALQAMASAAPSQIRGDFETFVTAFNGYAQALSKTGYKLGSVPTAAQVAQLEAAAKAFSTGKLRAAEQHLSAWARTNCTAKG